MKLISFSFFLLLILKTYAQIGGIYNDYSSKLIEYSDNIFYIIGTTKNNSDKGSDDILLLKLDLNSQKITSVTLGKNDNDRGYGICKLSDNNILITGESWKTFNKWGRENAFLVKLDNDMNTIWDKGYYAYGRDAGLTCKELSDGNLMLVGYTRSYDLAPHSIGDVLIKKTTPKGDTIWNTAINSAGNDYGFDFIELDNGNILILAESSGFFNSNQADYRFAHDADIMLIELDKNGNEIQRKYWGGSGHDLASKIIKAPDNSGFYIIGSTQSYGNGNFDILLLKIDNNYDEIWHKTFGEEAIDYGNSICISNDNQKIAIAATTTNYDALPQATIIYLDINGNEIWTKNISIDSLTFAADIIATKDNNFALTGYAGKYFDKYDIFFSKISKDSNIINIKLFDKFVKVYPNPVITNKPLTFEITNKDAWGFCSYQFLIFDCTGKIVYKTSSATEVFQINTSIFRSGIYFYKFIFSDNYIFKGKFIVTQ